VARSQTFNSLSRDHIGFILGLIERANEAIRFQLPLSGSPRGEKYFRILKINGLSTPSLGITLLSFIAGFGANEGTFNSLSRDHASQNAESNVVSVITFNSLSRDHSSTMRAETIITAQFTFNSLSRDHFRGIIDEKTLDALLTFNSLSRDHGKEVPSPLEAEATLRLSTPSLGITYRLKMMTYR